ncbi:oxidoreductase [Acetobacter nitrogenifigens DSM 23921 = NBRC 105050]|uniref:NADP oxidoreductase n=3 Tax=Acetobacter nitrogenifigens TaxID=285268 RepID=A0A511XDC5_9PROT|nr:NAD(P)-binding domain-containing protein [Acetobacter nitrogenifigens]GBQ89896.1 oxidoreductase [Acetobacter nitrogenifigens DSM 23921 = NBRC 105050]GEN60958.1 NADP oxidoreductase [Acetobacter nitrogenifigens DSM 23921 = NBRC 105050]
MKALKRRTALGMISAAAILAFAYRGHAEPPRLKIGMIGAGQVGTTLARLWIGSGYPVMLSARSLDEAKLAAVQLGPLASAGTPEQAAKFGDVVVLAVPYRAIPALGQKLGALVKGKTLLDPSNFYSFRDGAIAETAARDGAGPTTQRYFPGAHVVRGFNSIDMSALGAEAHRAEPRLAIPVAGDDPAAVDNVSGLVRAAGFDPVVTGDLASSVLFQPGGPAFEVKKDVAGLKAALSQP